MESPEGDASVRRVHNVSPDEERTLIKRFGDLLSSQEIHEFDRPPTEAEAEIVSKVIGKLPGFIREYRGTPVALSERNVHILDLEKIPADVRRVLAERDDKGWYRFDLQGAIVMPDESRLATAERIVHELIHLESYVTAQPEDRGAGHLDRITTISGQPVGPKRIGFSVFTTDGKRRLFQSLNESITEALTIRFAERYFPAVPALAKEVDARDRMRARVTEGSRKDISAVVTKKDIDEWRTTIREYAYTEERVKLQELVADLYERNKQSFRSQEDVFKLFAKAALGGDLLEVARLVERTYGKGSFRKLAEEKPVG